MFIEVHEVITDDSVTAELKVSWCRQLDKGWKVLSTENIRVRAHEYRKWVRYHPRGEAIDAD